MDIPKYNRVYAKKVGNSVEVKPEYVYMTIPSKYVCIYIRLLYLIADVGDAILEDCAVTCKGKNNIVVSNWNMFQSALACNALGKEADCDRIMKYIEKQIRHIYSVENIPYDDILEVPVSEDGQIKVICQCGEQVKFVTDEVTANNYKEYETHKDDGKTFVMW